MSTAAPPPSLRSLFSELEQLFQIETEARVSTSVQAAERALAEHLNQAVRRLRQAADFAEMAVILCDASVRFADAFAVFQIVEDSIRGERLRGATAEIADGFRETQFPAAAGAAFAGAIESREPMTALCSAAEVSPAVMDIFGHAPGDKAYLFPVTVGRATTGVLYATGVADVAVLELLAQAAAAALEAKQRPPKRADLVRIEAAATPAGGPAPEWDQLTTADQHLHLSAQRFARVKVAEMRLYRSEAVKAGRTQKDLYGALQPDIDSARTEYQQTFMAASKSMVDYLHAELLKSLASGDAGWMGGRYPGSLV